MELVNAIRVHEKYFLICLVLLRMAFCSADVSVPLKKKGEFVYGNFMLGENGWVLQKNDSLLSQIEVRSDMECASFCVWHHLCLSVNTEVMTNKRNTVHCELLSYGRNDYLNYLTKKDGFVHMRLETICSQQPCVMKHVICIPHLGIPDKPFTCVCPGHANQQRCSAGSIACNALGVEDDTILNSQMTASSIASSTYQPYRARINKASSWCPDFNKRDNSWLQVDLLKSTTIVAVATQGRYGYADRYVKTYQLEYSVDGVVWSTYKEAGTEKLFQGNVNNVAVVKHELKEPFVAKLVRIMFKSYSKSPCGRIELYGCRQ